MGCLMLNGAAVEPPQFLPMEEVAACKTYREAVRLSWAHRRVKGMTLRTCAEYMDAYAPHVTDYLAADDKPSRRDLPADKLNAWACVTGNWGVQQWLARDAELHIMEEMIARKVA